jgi:hypothetical protein
MLGGAGRLVLGSACVFVAEWLLAKLAVLTAGGDYHRRRSRAASRLVLDVVAAGCLCRKSSLMHESLWMVLLREYCRSVWALVVGVRSPPWRLCYW